MTPLEFIEPKPWPWLSVLLYGPIGEGKSTAAASAPGPIVYCNADGPGALLSARKRHAGTEILELPIDGRRPLNELYVALRDNELEGVQTVVLDSLGRIYDVVLNDIAGLDERGKQRKPSLPNRDDANTYIERYVLSLLEMPVHLALVAHDNAVVVTGSEEHGTAEVELFPFTGVGNAKLARKLMRPLHVVAYCGRRMVRNDDGTEREQFLGQVIKAGGRHAKDRTDVIGARADGDVPRGFAELDLTAWVERFRKEYSAGVQPAPTNDKKEVVAV
jgi:AAA domain